MEFIIISIVLSTFFRRTLKYLIPKINKKMPHPLVSILILVSIYLLFWNLLHYLISLAGRGNIYSVLGVTKFANNQEINKHFKIAYKQYHPDKNLSNREIFFRLGGYYDTITEPDSRYFYDSFGIELNQDQGLNLRIIFLSLLKIFKDFTNVIIALSLCIVYSLKINYVLIQFLFVKSMTVYILFFKSKWDILDLVFPKMLSFEIISFLYKGAVFHSIFFSIIVDYFICKNHKRKIEFITKFRKRETNKK